MNRCTRSRLHVALLPYALISLLALFLLPTDEANARGGRYRGLAPEARAELEAANVNKYVGEFAPETSEDAGNGWTKHTYDSEGGDGPLCIDGSDFIVYTRPGSDPDRIAIFLDGGGACWQDFYFCETQSDATAPPDVGIFASGFDTENRRIKNPLANYSMVAASYCDGSVWAGDNSVEDPNFPDSPVRHHRGLRNLTAALDLAKDEFGTPRRLFLSGASAGGVGAAIFAPSVARFVWGNGPQIDLFNDAGPVVANLLPIFLVQQAVAARAADWGFVDFYPASCTECAPEAQATRFIEWRLARDNKLKEAFYSTDGDSTNRFFTFVFSQIEYRFLLLIEHGIVQAQFPDTYKVFVRSGDDSHTALATDLFYTSDANGVPLHKWTRDFIKDKPTWVSIFEDYVPVP